MVINLLENIKIQRIIPINLNDTSISSWYVRNNPNTTEKVSEILGKNVENLVTVVLQSKRQLLHPLTKERSYNWTVNRPPPPAGSAHTPSATNHSQKSALPMKTSDRNRSRRGWFIRSGRKREFRACALVIARDRDCPSLGEAEKGGKGIRRSFHGSK